MADLRDEHGNPIQLTDQYGHPVELKDEYGNPMHLSGVAITASAVHATGTGPTPTTAGGIGVGVGGEQRQEQLHRSSSSSSSSSEDDGQGGRRKKKGLKDKIKEKLHGGKHKDRDDVQQQQEPAHSATSAPTNTAGSATSGHHLDQPHEKKSMMEKIKEKLPGHRH